MILTMSHELISVIPRDKIRLFSAVSKRKYSSIIFTRSIILIYNTLWGSTANAESIHSKITNMGYHINERGVCNQGIRNRRFLQLYTINKSKSQRFVFHQVHLNINTLIILSNTNQPYQKFHHVA